VRQPVLDGEAGGLFLRPPSDLPVLAIDVDNYLEEEGFFQRLVNEYFSGSYAAVIGVHEVPDITRYANVKISDRNLLLDIVEKPTREAAFGNLAKMGCYVIGPEMIRRGKYFFHDSKGDLATTAAFSNSSAEGNPIKCVPHRGYYIDIGTLDGYLSHLNGSDQL
jgi:NDP-sugar pyrophosphorylase family protein